jgi:hypothetical protein
MSTYNTSLPSPDYDNIFRIGNNEYYIDLILYNANEEFVRLRVQNITELVIEDNITDFFHKGYVVFKNNNDAVERISNLPSASVLSNYFNRAYIGTDKILPYSFRGDCRDFFLVDIMPRISDNTQNYNYGEQIEKLWRLKNVFVIYNTEDIQGTNPDEKFKKLYFWDYNYELLREKNVDFSTADYLQTKDKILLDNNDRGIKTGLALKNFLKTAFPEREGFDVKFGEWNEGATTIFYSSPTDSKAINDLEYMLDHHVSENNSNYDFCLLRKERFTNEWTLKSLKDYFDKAYTRSITNNVDGGGELHLERFIIPTTDVIDATRSNNTRTPLGPKNNAYLPDYSVIENYSFSPPAGMDVQQFITTKIVHTYDPTDKSFNMDVQENQFDRILEIFKKNYVTSQKGSGGSNAFSSLTKNDYRITNINFDNVYTPYFESKEQRLAFGRNDVLIKALMLNNTLNFKSPGLTLRQSGRFISVDRNSSQPESKFDDKLLGTYFIVNVKHIFRNNVYTNDITCVKPYIFSDPKNNEVVL